jgi:hypothetical protein
LTTVAVTTVVLPSSGAPVAVEVSALKNGAALALEVASSSNGAAVKADLQRLTFTLRPLLRRVEGAEANDVAASESPLEALARTDLIVDRERRARIGVPQSEGAVAPGDSVRIALVGLVGCLSLGRL